MKPRRPQNATDLPSDVSTSFMQPSQASGYSVSATPTSRPTSQNQLQNFESFRFSSSTFTSQVTAQLMLGANIRRKYLLIQNNSINTIYIGFGTKPNNNGVNALVLPPNAGISFENKVVPNNDVFVISPLPSQITIVEGSII